MRVVRLVRVFRMLKFGKYSEGLQLLGGTLVKSLKSMGMILFILSIAITVFASLIHYTERGEWCDHVNGYCQGTAPDDRPGWYAVPGLFEGSTYVHGCTSDKGYCRHRSEFDSIFSAAYWTMTAFTTTGYGDTYPRTAIGRVIACFVMFNGLLLLALPITVISGNFAKEYATQELAKIEAKERQLREEKAQAEADRIALEFGERRAIMRTRVSALGSFISSLPRLSARSSSVRSSPFSAVSQRTPASPQQADGSGTPASASAPIVTLSGAAFGLEATVVDSDPHTDARSLLSVRGERGELPDLRAWVEQVAPGAMHGGEGSAELADELQESWKALSAAVCGSHFGAVVNMHAGSSRQERITSRVQGKQGGKGKTSAKGAKSVPGEEKGARVDAVAWSAILEAHRTAVHSSPRAPQLRVPCATPEPPRGRPAAAPVPLPQALSAGRAAGARQGAGGADAGHARAC